MKNPEIVGIDVSKFTLDLFFLSNSKTHLIENSTKGFVELLEVCSYEFPEKKQDILFCFEDTGRYSKPLSIFLQESGFPFIIINALDLKRSLGLTRGKSDKSDARLIAKYAWEKRDEIEPSVLSNPLSDQLKSLLTLREKLIKHRTSYKNGIKDMHDCYYDGEFEFARESQKRMIAQLNKEIDKTEKQILKLFKQNTMLHKNYELLLSIRGIGKVLAIYMIVLTENFMKFNDPRKFACFAGIAPFPFQSGVSIKGRTKLHPCANKQIKSLLNVAAMSAIQNKGEYKLYYERRCKEGKNKMSTLNIIRNKLVFRAFAVVKRGTPYVDLSNFAA